MENSPLEDHFLNGNFPRVFHQIFHQKISQKNLGTWRIIAKGNDPWNLRNRKSSGFNGNIIYKWGFYPRYHRFFYLPIPLILEDRGVILQVRSQSSMAFKGGWRVRRRCRQESGHVEELVGYKPTHQRYHIIYLFIYHAYSTDTCIIQDRYRI